MQAKDNIHPKDGFDGKTLQFLVLQIARGTLGADDFVDFCEGRCYCFLPVWPGWNLDHGFGGCSTIFMGMNHLSMSIIEDDYYLCRGFTIRNIPSFIKADHFLYVCSHFSFVHFKFHVFLVQLRLPYQTSLIMIHPSVFPCFFSPMAVRRDIPQSSFTRTPEKLQSLFIFVSSVEDHHFSQISTNPFLCLKFFKSL